MANSIDLITRYSTKAWDKVYKAEAISSLFDAPESQVQFTGAKTVKIAKFQAGGLGNYYRNNDTDGYELMGSHFGYQAANAGLVWEEFTLKCDRSARYQIEMFDNEETDGLAIGAATTEISRTVMVPEVDAYCFSTIADRAEFGASYNLADLNPVNGNKPTVDKLNEGLLHFEEYEVPAERQVILMAPKYMSLLRRDSVEMARLLQSDFNKDVKFSMTKYEGRDLAIVPPQRFKTKIRLHENGYGWGADSKDILFMIVSKDAVLHVVKYNKIKIISGDINLAGANFDGYSIFARIYHDTFVLDNKLPGIYVVTAGDYAARYATAEILVKLVSDKVVEIKLNQPDRLVKFVTSTEEEVVGDTVKGTLTRVKVGTTLTTGNKVYAVDGSTVVAVKTI